MTLSDTLSQLLELTKTMKKDSRTACEPSQESHQYATPSTSETLASLMELTQNLEEKRSVNSIESSVSDNKSGCEPMQTALHLTKASTSETLDSLIEITQNIEQRRPEQGSNETPVAALSCSDTLASLIQLTQGSVTDTEVSRDPSPAPPTDTLERLSVLTQVMDNRTVAEDKSPREAEKSELSDDARTCKEMEQTSKTISQKYSSVLQNQIVRDTDVEQSDCMNTEYMEYADIKDEFASSDSKSNYISANGTCEKNELKITERLQEWEALNSLRQNTIAPQNNSNCVENLAGLELVQAISEKQEAEARLVAAEHKIKELEAALRGGAALPPGKYQPESVSRPRAPPGPPIPPPPPPRTVATSTGRDRAAAPPTAGTAGCGGSRPRGMKRKKDLAVDEGHEGVMMVGEEEVVTHQTKLEEAVLHLCDGCSFQTDVLEDFVDHIDNEILKESSHSSHGSHTQTCLLCGEKIGRKKHLKSHYASAHGKIKTLFCSECSFSSFSKELIHSHKFTKHISNQYTCRTCSSTQPNEVTSFNTSVLFREHLRSHRNICQVKTRQKIEKKIGKKSDAQIGFTKDGILLSCSECEYTCTKHHNLLRHRREKHKKLIPCSQCSFNAVTPNDLIKHTNRTHKNMTKDLQKEIFEKNNISYDPQNTCDICFILKRNETEVMEHKKSKHETAYECKQCSFKGKYPFQLKDHIESLHEKKVRYICDECGYQFFRRCKLTTHLMKVHEIFVDPQKLVDHGKIEKIDRKATIKLLCNICEFVVSTESSLDEHKLKVHNKQKTNYSDYISSETVTANDQQDETPIEQNLVKNAANNESVKTNFQCTVEACAKEYVAQTALWDHQQMTHGSFFCHCRATFETRKAIRKHQQSEHGVNIVKVISCTQCSFKSKDETKIKNHIETSHKPKELKYSCLQCNFKACYKVNLNRHMKQAHID